MASAGDEGRHEAGSEPLWNESWYFDFAEPDGSIGGYVRLGLYPQLGVAWYWGYLVRDGEQLLVVQHHTARLPKGDVLEVREDGLWSQLHCETPNEHWSIGLEAFAVGLDSPGDAYADGEVRGDKVPLGLDLEWEAIAPVYDYPGPTRYEQSCLVSGEILIGNQAISFDGWGQRDHSWGVRDWWAPPGWVWTAGRLDDGTAFHAVKVLTDAFDFEPGYVVAPEASELTVASQFKPSFDWDEAAGGYGFPTATAMPLHDLELTCTPLHLAPIRLDAPDGRVARFPRALCRFDAADGRSGFGWTEWNRPQTA
jgi:hypothetical protein